MSHTWNLFFSEKRRREARRGETRRDEAALEKIESNRSEPRATAFEAKEQNLASFRAL
jgi:hypothetical protein